MTQWTDEMKLDVLMKLPWTIARSPGDEPDEIILRVPELPGMIVIGTNEELQTEFWAALRATLETYLQFGDPIPLPPGIHGTMPWAQPAREQQPQLVLRVTKEKQVAAPQLTAGPAEFIEANELAVVPAA